MHKILNDKAPVYLRNRFKTSNVDDLYLLRKREMSLVLPRPKTEYLKNSFDYIGAKLWNNLPEEVRLINNHKIFKKCLDSLPL